MAATRDTKPKNNANNFLADLAFDYFIYEAAKQNLPDTIVERWRHFSAVVAELKTADKIGFLDLVRTGATKFSNYKSQYSSVFTQKYATKMKELLDIEHSAKHSMLKDATVKTFIVKKTADIESVIEQNYDNSNPFFYLLIRDKESARDYLYAKDILGNEIKGCIYQEPALAFLHGKTINDMANTSLAPSISLNLNKDIAEFIPYKTRVEFTENFKNQAKMIEDNIKLKFKSYQCTSTHNIESFDLLVSWARLELINILDNIENNVEIKANIIQAKSWFDRIANNFRKLFESLKPSDSGRRFTCSGNGLATVEAIKQQIAKNNIIMVSTKLNSELGSLQGDVKEVLRNKELAPQARGFNEALIYGFLDSYQNCIASFKKSVTAKEIQPEQDSEKSTQRIAIG